MDKKHVETYAKAAQCRAELHTAAVLTSRASYGYRSFLSAESRRKLDEAMVALGEVKEEAEAHLAAMLECSE